MKLKILLLTTILLIACDSEPININIDLPLEIDSQDLENFNSTQQQLKTITSSSLPGVDSNFNFQAQIPSGWQLEYIPASLAINIFDPASTADSNLEKSQIFIKYFNASQFLTLSTVTIHSQEETQINGRPTVIYDIEKKPSAKDFPSQPTWRNQRHIVTDIRSTDTSPSTFYVFARKPELDLQIFNDFIQSVNFNAQETDPIAREPTQDSITTPTSITQNPTLVYPIKNFTNQITKKPFGIYIDPKTSPVQPERFSGYHNAVDIEVIPSENIPIYSISSGTILAKRNVSGYGGLLQILHNVEGQDYTALYGHLRLSSITKNVGDTVQAGEQIAFLGSEFSNQTDGERQHLHFAILPGKNLNLAGYVPTQSDLKGWIDPAEFLREKGAQ